MGARDRRCYRAEPFSLSSRYNYITNLKCVMPVQEDVLLSQCLSTDRRPDVKLVVW